MRDYLMPAAKYLTKVMPHPSVVKAFLIKRRAAVFMIVAALLMLTTSLLITARNMVAEAATHSVKPNANTNLTVSSSASSTPTPTPESQAADDSQAGVTASQQVTNVVSPSTGQTHTSVTVNNQTIDVPENGTVQKTIQSDNGTSNVNVTVNGNTTNSNVSTSSSNVHVFSNSVNQNTDIKSQ